MKPEIFKQPRSLSEYDRAATGDKQDLDTQPDSVIKRATILISYNSLQCGIIVRSFSTHCSNSKCVLLHLH